MENALQSTIEALFWEEVNKPQTKRIFLNLLKKDPAVVRQFQAAVANIAPTVEALYRRKLRKEDPQDARYMEILNGGFEADLWTEWFKSIDLGPYWRQFVESERKRFITFYQQNPNELQAALMKRQAAQQIQVPVPGGTKWNPKAANNNCAHVCVAYILSRGGDGCTADTVAEMSGIPVASPGTGGIGNVQVRELAQQFNLWERPHEYSDLESLRTDLSTLSDGEDDSRLGYHMLMYGRDGSGHAVILNLQRGKREWIEPQVSAGANVNDIEGIAAGGAQWWLLLGPFWK